MRRCVPLRRPCRSVFRPCPAYRSSIAFRSVCATAGLRAARPLFARIACPRAPAFAPARLARLIAHARASVERTSPVRSYGSFSRRCEAASGCRFLSHSTTDFTGSSLYKELFQIIRTNRGFCPSGLVPAGSGPAFGSSPRTPIRVWTPPWMQAVFRLGHAVRRSRVSGLSVRHRERRGPVWRYADRVHIGAKCSKAPRIGLVFPVPSH